MPVILIIIGLGLIIYNYNAIKKESIPFEIRDKKEDPFKKVLQNNKEDLNDYKIELGILRKTIAESLTELQEEIFEIKNHLNMVKKDENLYDNNEEIKILSSDYKNNENSLMNNLENTNDVVSEINFINKEEMVDSNKTEKIKKLLKEGLSEEEICYKLSISKGEVLLVKELFKK